MQLLKEGKKEGGILISERDVPGSHTSPPNRIWTECTGGGSSLYLLQQADCPLLSLEAAPGLLSDGYDVCGNAGNSHAELISRLGVAMNLCGWSFHGPILFLQDGNYS